MSPSSRRAVCCSPEKWWGLVVLLATIVGVCWFAYRSPKRITQPPSDNEVVHCLFAIHDETRASQACRAVVKAASHQVKFPVKASPGLVVEAGLIRTGTPYRYSGDFRFRVYQETGSEKNVLVDTTRSFLQHERVSFRFDAKQIDRGEDTPEIVYEVTAVPSPGDPVDGLALHQDFSYLVPNVFHESRAEDLNILLISFDTLRADHLGCYGYEINTSAQLDEFATRSVRFEQAISPAPWTTPAHYSLFTALLPSAHQNRRNLGDNRFYYAQQTLASLLQDHGYYTIALTGGGSVSSRFGFAKGFNIYNEYMSLSNTTSPGRPWPHEDDTGKIFSKAIDWLQQNRDTKFFMFLHTFECHDPYENRHFISEENRRKTIDERTALYDGDIHYADQHFGKLIDHMESLGLMSNTMILFLSDHGEDFYDHYRETDILPKYQKPVIPEISEVDHAHSLYEELLHVPLLWYVPGLKPAKSVLDNPVSLIDVLPTVLDILNLEYKGPVQGKSLYSLMQTGNREEDPAIISEFPDFGPERKSIRKDDFKYIWIDKPQHVRNRRSYRNLEQHQLFNLISDPDEKHNLYHEKPVLAQQYHKMLQQEVEASLAIHQFLRQRFQPDSQQAVEPDKEIIRQLKALGYLQ